MMSTCCSKHVEAWNKYIKKECVKLVINQNYVKMHGQQNIKLWSLLFVRTNGVWNWLSVAKWRGFTWRLWLWFYILLDPQALFVKNLDSEYPCIWIFDGEIHLCATRHGNTLILVLIYICDKVSKCNVNSRKMIVVQSKWVLSQGCPQLPVIKTANGAVFTANSWYGK
jgi:hypothetical protein